MMIYQKRIKFGRNRKFLFWIPLATLAVIAFYFSVTSFLPKIFMAIGLPIWSAGNSFSNRFSIDLSFAPRGELISRVRNLEESLKNEKLKSAAAAALSKENEELKSLFGRSDGKTEILAAVIGRPPSTLYDTFILDVGARAGVLKGDSVVAAGLYPIGKITTVFPDYSRATLFSSPGNEINVLLGSENTETLARGMGGYYLAEVPQEFPVSEGDAVILPDLNLQIYGFVQNVRSRPASPFKYVFFGSPINTNSIRFVTIQRSEIFEDAGSEP